ncbi:hypothetical protein NW256_10505 [Klebsiella pneumoniae]|uniref:hypothetical protein n=1 Tax=Klebsiella pneumoniae TaxID=573 RepID=UPI00164A3D0C|nr:hypothetical protein [Klebsiella pneumoniae]MBC4816640.1 hypothetical protein [Klebsiella pneumoniae]MBC4827084.1 hypothetical protein [Klebsiella pneumoniae]MCT4359908.1 hypothetical protein [Klebsiella pneumoniae]
MAGLLRKFLISSACLIFISGCNDSSPSEMVKKFIETKDISLLSKSKTSMCSKRFVQNFHYIDENTLPTTNEYYELSKYLYSKASYNVVSEEKQGDETIVIVDVRLPKPIEDAGSFLFAEGDFITSKEKSRLDNLKSLYEKGLLDDMDFIDFQMKWRVISDGIDPGYNQNQLSKCADE